MKKLCILLLLLGVGQAEPVSFRIFSAPIHITSTTNDTSLVVADSLIVRSAARIRNVYVDSLTVLKGFTSAPLTCNAGNRGKVYYHTTVNKRYFCNASSWKLMGGTASSDAPTAAQILTGKDCYDGSTLITGTMPNIGTVNYTPTTSNLTIAAGYHSGSGACVGSATMVGSNIKSGITINTVAGTLSPAGTAVAADALSGKTFYSGDSYTQKTGTMTDRGTVNYTGAASNTTIATGKHSGSGACLGDVDFVAANIKSGTTINGVAGTAACHPVAVCGVSYNTSKTYSGVQTMDTLQGSCIDAVAVSDDAVRQCAADGCEPSVAAGYIWGYDIQPDYAMENIDQWYSNSAGNGNFQCTQTSAAGSHWVSVGSGGNECLPTAACGY